jgi:hypothetical protein
MGAAVAKRLWVAEMACVLVWQLAPHQVPELQGLLGQFRPAAPDTG